MVLDSFRSVRWITALLAAGMSAGAAADVVDSTSVDRLIERASLPLPAEVGRGWSLAIDNDLFAPAQSDRDYTGGLGGTISGMQSADYWWSLDPVLGRIDRFVLPEGEDLPASNAHHAVQVGLLSFTPEDLRDAEVVTADRPYASLLFITTARQYVASDKRSLRYSELTLGALGLSLTSDLHNAIHRAVGSDPPRGYGNQE